MTVAVQQSQAGPYTSTGVEVDFNTVFEFDASSELVVTYGATGVESTFVLGADYTVSGGLGAAGRIHLLAGALAAGQKLIIKRATPVTQPLALSGATTWDPAALMAALDKITRIEQELFDGKVGSSTLIHGNLGGGALHAQVVRGDHTVPGSGTAGFLGGDNYDFILDHIEVVAGNPHGVTAAMIAAAPLAHVGSRDVVAGHPLATATLAGFMAAADKAKLDGILASDPRTVFFDDFDGPQLWADKWARSTTGTAPTASILTDEYGVYRELSSGAGAGLVLLRSTAKGPSPKRGIVWRARVALGRQGPNQANCTVRMGMSADPTLAHGADANYGYFFWDGTQMFIEAGAGARQSNGIGGVSTAFHDYEIDFAADGTGTSFFIDGVLIAKLSLQIPTAATALERFFEFAGTSAAARSFDFDYCEVIIGSRVYT